MARGAIYFPTSGENIAAIVRFAEIIPGQKIADLGSGDGRILIVLARAGAEAHGYEINPILVYRSRRAIKKAGLQGGAFVHWKSFWKVDTSSYSTVVVYGIPFIMDALGTKLKHELSPGAKVISNVFTFRNLGAGQSMGRVHRYSI